MSEDILLIGTNPLFEDALVKGTDYSSDTLWCLGDVKDYVSPYMGSLKNIYISDTRGVLLSLEKGMIKGGSVGWTEHPLESIIVKGLSLEWEANIGK